MPSDAIIFVKRKRVVKAIKEIINVVTNLRGSFDALAQTDKNNLSVLNGTIKFLTKADLGLEG